ncbi:MAG: phage tail tube protein, partial [Elioraea tepidiphila]
MAQTLGIVDVVWRGRRLPVEKGAKFKPGGLVSKPVVTGRRVDRAEEFQPGEVKATTVLLRGQRLADLYSTG